MRVRWLFVFVVCALLASACDWAQFRFGPAHTGVNLDNSIGVDTVGSLVLDWTATTTTPIKGSPAVANGEVYIGGDQQYLHAYDAAGVKNCAGTPKVCSDVWRGIDAFGVGVSSPASVGDLVYVGSDVGDIYAFQRGCNNCDYHWVGGLNGAANSSPAVANGVVYMTSAAESSKLFAFDAAGGPAGHCDPNYQVCQPLWTGAFDGGDNQSPAVSNGMVYAAGTGISVFDAAGTKNCSGTPKQCSPLFVDQIAPFTSASSSPAVADGRVYVGSYDGRLYAFDAAGKTNCSGGATPSCTPLWTAQTGAALHSSTAIANGNVYVGSNDGKLYAFDSAGIQNCSSTLHTCDPLWTATTGGAVESSPAIVNGVVYVGSDDGKLYAFDAHGTVGCSGTTKTCAPLWSATTGGAVSSSPAVVNGHVYVGSQDGKLYAFALPGA